MTMQRESNQIESLDAPSTRSRRDIITANLVTALRDVAQQNGCFIFGPEMNVWALGEVLAPTVSVVCGPVTWHDENQAILANPVMLIDIISTNIADKGREQRLKRIRSIRSLTNYLRVNENRVHVEKFGGKWNSYWFHSEETSLSAILGISGISASIAVADIYRRVSFDADAEL